MDATVDSLVLASSAPTWISSGAALVGALLAFEAIRLARIGVANAMQATEISGEAKEIAERSSDLERRKVLGSIVGIHEVTGLSFKLDRMLVVLVADYGPEWRKPQVLTANLIREDGSEFGQASYQPRLFRPQDYYWLPDREATTSTVPEYKAKPEKVSESQFLGLMFRLLEEDLEELGATPLTDKPILKQNRETYRLPNNLLLHLVVLDPLGQQKVVSAVGGRSFYFRDNDFVENPWSTVKD